MLNFFLKPPTRFAASKIVTQLIPAELSLLSVSWQVPRACVGSACGAPVRMARGNSIHYVWILPA